MALKRRTDDENSAHERWIGQGAPRCSACCRPGFRVASRGHPCALFPVDDREQGVARPWERIDVTPGRQSGAQPPWHALSVEDTLGELVTTARGLSRAEARSRLERQGENVLEAVSPAGALEVLLHQFRSPLIYILGIATVVTLLLEEFIDASAIAAVLLLNAVIGFTQERRAEASVRALMKLVSPRARVLREGREWDLDSRELVPGDVVLVESGVRVPADLRLMSVNSLQVDESLLTGESVPVQKSAEPLPEPDRMLADRLNMAYAGSIVASGRARGVVVATGMGTELGTIAGHMRLQDIPETPLQHRMSRFATLIGVVAALAAAGAFGLGVARGESASQMFTVAVALAVSAIPEGLPVAFTITLALGVRRMARRSAIVRRLPAVETLGSTTIICSDKTGTLTGNRMTVREVWTGGRTYRIEGDAVAPVDQHDLDVAPLVEHQALYQTLLAGVLSSEAEIYRVEGNLESQGDPTETALLVAAANLGIEPEEARQTYRSVIEAPFESERQYSASLRQRDDRNIVFVKGSPEKLIGMSRTALGDAGVAPLEPNAAHEVVDAMAERGLRVLAMAYCEIHDSDADLTSLDGLVFLGLQGLLDPPRSGVREAIAGCREAGIRVVMVTGDHVATASAIARELGIASARPAVLTGRDLEAIGDVELERRVAGIDVYARAAPEHKLRIVNALRRTGEVVAVTGDGVNDAPALRAADIGIAMGKGGTDVAREAADMVLADDNFVTIYAAVEEGRTTFGNIRKVTFFLVSTGAAEIVAILASVALGWPVPLLAAQLLWLNLVTNGLQDVALAFEPGERGTLKRPPRPRGEGIISPLLWERTVLSGLVMAAGTLALFRWELDTTGSEDSARTVALTTMVLFQVMHVGNSRSEWVSAFAKSPFSNPFLFAATGAALTVHVVALYLPPTQFVFRIEPLELEAWGRMVLVALGVVVTVEAHKFVRGGLRPYLGLHTAEAAG